MYIKIDVVFVLCSANIRYFSLHNTNSTYSFLQMIVE